MSRKLFDEKFGTSWLTTVSTGPGVYRFWDANHVVIYVGKAKNLRRRLQGYRNASRKKTHRKMNRIIGRASFLTFETVATESEALLLENRLIQELAPELNVEGAYTFLYPAVGVGESDKHFLLCFTTDPERFGSLGLRWCGTFRSRARAKEAFAALVDLLALIGHKEKRSALPSIQVERGSRLVGFRQIPLDLSESLPWFLAGEDRTFLSALCRLLLSKPRARREAGDVEEKLRSLDRFFDRDASQLHEALRSLGKPGSFISASERDALFIRARFERATAPGSATCPADG